jgi:hypothetical protein
MCTGEAISRQMHERSRQASHEAEALCDRHLAEEVELDFFGFRRGVGKHWIYPFRWTIALELPGSDPS